MGMFLGFGLFFASSVMASEAGFGMPSVKDIAAQQAKGMVNKATDAANEKATQKIDEYAGTASKIQEKATNATKALDKKTEDTKKKMHEMHEMHEKAKHEMHEMQEMKEHGQKMMHEMQGK